MLNVMTDAEKLLEFARQELERIKVEGPKPIRWAGYVVHAMGREVWLVPAGNTDEQNEIRN